MTDIHCKHCGEPWDHDFLHEIDYMTYDNAGHAFAIYGCGFRHGVRCTSPMVDPDAATLSAALQEQSPFPEEWII